MNRHRVNLGLNLLLYGAFVSLALSGFALDLAFGHGLGREAVWLGISRHAWTQFHSVSAYLFVAVGVLHLSMHWAWINMALLGQGPSGPLRRSVAWIGLGLAGILIVATVALPLLLPGTPGAGEPGQAQRWGQESRD